MWFNSNIRKGNKMMSMKELYQNGVKHVKDLLHNNKIRWYTLEEVNKWYGINLNFLDYLSILQAIPKSWRRIIHDDVEFIDITTEHLLEKIIRYKKPVKQLYKYLVLRDCTPPDS